MPKRPSRLVKSFFLESGQNRMYDACIQGCVNLDGETHVHSNYDTCGGHLYHALSTDAYLFLFGFCPFRTLTTTIWTDATLG